MNVTKKDITDTTKDDPFASAGSPSSSREPLIVEVPTVLTRIDAQLRAQSTTESVASAPPGCVCADCGHEQSTMDPCENCRSIRVVLVTVIIKLFGENWRDAFKNDEAP